MSDDPRTIPEEPPTILEEPSTVIEEPATIRETPAGGDAPGVLSTFRDCRVTEAFPARGGEADIYLVERDGERLLLKLYRLGMEPSEEVLRQVSALGTRFPDQIVSIREFGRDDRTRRWYELMEYAVEGSLRELVAGGIGPELAVLAAREIARAITVLHRHNVLHLDLKPSNILVRSRQPLSLVFTDFGVSSIIDPELSRKLTTVKGTPHYWSPESISGVVGKEADYWALGIIILELLLGRHPFSGIDNKVIMYNLATRGVDIPAGIEPRFLPLLQGLLTREPHLRWGEEQVGRWLGGDTAIPVHYRQGERTPPAGTRVDYRFLGQEFSTPAALAALLAAEPAAWKEIGNHLESGQLEKWLSDCGDYEGSTRVHVIAEGAGDNLELAIVRLIYGFDPALPFALYGKLVTPANLRLFLQKFLQRSTSEAEDAIVDDLLKGELLRLYREYLLAAAREPDDLAAILETVSRLVSINEYDYNFEEDLLPVASFFEALHDPAGWLLPAGWPGELAGRIPEAAREARYLLRQDQYRQLREEYWIPAELCDALARGAGSTDWGRFFKLLRLLTEHRDKKLLVARRELADLEARFLLPAGLAPAIRGARFDAAVKAAGVLRSLQAEQLLIPREGLEEFLERNRVALRITLADDRLLSAGGENDIPISEYRRLARYVQQAIPAHLFPKLAAIGDAFESAAELDPQARLAPLYRYLEGLRSLRVRWDASDNDAVKEIWEHLFNRKDPASTLLGTAAADTDDRWGRRLEIFMRRSFDPATQERIWAGRGAIFGALIGVAVWFVVSTGTANSADQAEGNFLKVLLGAVVAMSIYRAWLPQLLIVAGSFALWRFGSGLLVGILLYGIIGANLMGILGVLLGRTRRAAAPNGDTIYRLYRARINDVIQQHEELCNGR